MPIQVTDIGCECQANGISKSMLLSYVSDSPQKLPQIPKVSNRLELNAVRDQNHLCTYRTLYCWISDLYGHNWPDEGQPTMKALTNSIDRLIARLARLKKQPTSSEKETVISQFFEESYALPKLGVLKGRVLPL